MNHIFSTQRDLISFVEDLLGETGNTAVAQAIVNTQGWHWTDTTADEIEVSDLIGIAAEMGY
jgi:hypothetical protein